MTLFVGVEGGATHTQLGLYDAAGLLIAERQDGPANPTAYGIPATARRIAEATRRLLDGRSCDEVHVLAALAGAADRNTQEAVAGAVGEQIRPASVLVTSDLHALLFANAGDGSGILVIAGTGAAALGRTVNGRLARAGGWGMLLGDEGSGYAVAVSGLRACARAQDGVGPKTQMVQTLPHAAGLTDFQAFVQWSTHAAKRDIAALAPIVAEAAEAGDIVARAGIEEEARRLAALVLALQERLGLDSGTRLFEYGGMFANCAFFRDAFHVAIGVYAEMQIMSCTVSGHHASFALAGSAVVPDWACRWNRQDSAVAITLPVTERVASRTPIDELSPHDFVLAMNHADGEVVSAVGAVGGAIAAAIEAAGAALRQGGRIIYVGAGTSGRLGALDAAECPPTFGVAPGRVVALVAGGNEALRTSVEGAEDSTSQGEEDIRHLGVCSMDFVVGIAASGTTPYVLGALEEAHKSGASTAFITSNTESAAAVDTLIAPDTGPELLAGSTRLKAGTAAKLVLNMISTGAMVQAGFVYQGRMVGMTPVNAKLRRRAVRIVVELSGVEAPEAIAALEAAGYNIATAVIMTAQGLSCDEARARLDRHEGSLRNAIKDVYA